MASKKTIQIVKATAPVLKEHGEQITKVFYELLFKNHPELRDVFNMTHQKKGSQPKVLANAIFQYATYIDKLEMLGDAVKSITQKHVSLSITPEMYPIVGKFLLLAIKKVLGDAATDEIIEAWAEAYGDLATILIDTEEAIYKNAEEDEGGYRGKKEFVVVKKVKESSTITSFYLKDIITKKSPSFKPGQYVAVTVKVPGEEHMHTRNYSLSDVSNKNYLRISVKKEELAPRGIVSNYMHSSVKVGDILQLGIPAGEFVLKQEEAPVLFIAAGVGITPLVSMYKTLQSTNWGKVSFINCVINSDVEAFKNELNLADGSEVVKVYSNPLVNDKLGIDYDYKGFITKEIVSKYLTDSTQIYFCGPTPFMRSLLKILNDLGVDNNRINYEFFGPKEDLDVTN